MELVAVMGVGAGVGAVGVRMKRVVVSIFVAACVGCAVVGGTV